MIPSAGEDVLESSDPRKSDPDQHHFPKWQELAGQGHLSGWSSAQEGWLNSSKREGSSNRSLKCVELLVLEQEKILTQFQIFKSIF